MEGENLHSTVETRPKCVVGCKNFRVHYVDARPYIEFDFDEKSFIKWLDGFPTMRLLKKLSIFNRELKVFMSSKLCSS